MAVLCLSEEIRKEKAKDCPDKEKLKQLENQMSGIQENVESLEDMIEPFLEEEPSPTPPEPPYSGGPKNIPPIIIY